MRRALIGMVFVLAALPAFAAEEDIVLRGMGSFHVGGRVAEVSGKPVREIVRQPGGPPTKLDPNGQYMVEQMYVQYFLPRNRKGKLPLLMWHGGGLTGVTYETTPDGREGWLNLFVRKGWDVYVSDAVERGRAGFARPDVWPSEPIFLTYADPFERFRIGDGEGSWNADPAKRKVLPGSQFPVEAYDNYMKQSVPRWLSTDKAIIAAYVALVDKVCPCVLLLHSQGGAFGFKVAEQRPGQGQGHRRGGVGERRQCRQGGGAEEHADPDAVRRLRRPASALGGVQEDRSRICRRGARRRRHRRRDQPPRHRHQGQFAHADAGQEQRRDRRGHPEMAGRERPGRVIAIDVSQCCIERMTREGAMRRFGIALAFSLAAGSAPGADQGADRSFATWARSMSAGG